MTTTPPVRQIVEPPTPLHGGHFNDFQPSTLRKNTRTSHRGSDRTPSPTGAERAARSTGASTPRRSTRNLSSSNTYSPPSSNPSSPQTMSRKRVQVGTNEAKKMLGDDMIEDVAAESSRGMLPTPVKTPRKKDVKQLPSAARVLFPNRPDTIEEAMPTPRKRARSNIGYSLQSFEDLPAGNADIEIYTDSKDKRPELDESADNPFYAKPGTSKRTSKNKAAKKNEMSEKVQEVLEKDEGMVYVFRGKKIYKKFDNGEVDPLPDGADEGLDLEQFETPRHFTRSSIKPRLLFPHATVQESSLTDEEAPTDIEDEQPSELEVETPSKPTKYAPATPPDSTRPKRTAKRAMLDSPSAGDSGGEADGSNFSVKRAKRPSPFMNWQRVKAGSSGSSSSRGKKRGSDDL